MQDHGGKSGANMKWLLRLFLKGAKKKLAGANFNNEEGKQRSQAHNW